MFHDRRRQLESSSAGKDLQLVIGRKLAGFWCMTGKKNERQHTGLNDFATVHIVFSKVSMEL